MSQIVKKHYNLLNYIAMGLVILVCLMFCAKKSGYYIDEYYLYTIANGTQLGIAIDPGRWNDTSEYMDQLVSSGNENFHFHQVYENDSNDVHPPLYYYLLHFVSSVFHDSFSKWIGLSINLVILIPVLFLVREIAWILSGNNEVVTILTVLTYGLSPATISMVVLIRMYLLLSLWTLLYVYIHVSDLKRDRLSTGRFLLPVFVTGFMGFLTQYFFVVIMFFITFVYGFYLMFFCKRVKDAIIYGLTALISLISTHLVWPFAYFHIFGGYRGQGAVSQLKDVTHYWDRIKTQFSYLNTMVFGKTLVLFIPILIVGVYILFTRCVQLKRSGVNNPVVELSIPTKAFIMILLAALLDYAVLGQISLMDGITCFRHIYTAYALFLILLPTGLYRLVVHLTKGKTNIASVVICMVMGLICFLGHYQKSVLFLYEEEKIATDYAKEHPNAKVVMFQNDDGNYDSRIQELILYPRIYYASVNDLSTAIDPEIANADELFVYVSTAVDPQICFDSIYEQNKNITEAEHLWDYYAFFSAYKLY